MPVESFKFRPVLIKTTAFIWCCAITISVNAQSAEQSSEKTSKQLTERPEKTLEPAAVDSEEISAENTQEEVEYDIDRKEHIENPCDRGLDAHSYEKQWYDESQIYVNSKFCEPALWFDNFFATDRLFDEGVAGTYVRWRNEFTYDEEEYFSYKMRLNFSIELPGFEDRMRLTFEADENEDLRDIAPGSQNEAENNLGLQLDLKETSRSKFSASISLSPKIRLRYRYTYPIYKHVILRFTQEIQRKQRENSALSLIQYEHTFKQNFLFRSSSQLQVSEEFNGVDWLQALVLYQRINKKTSLSYETSVNGITEPWTLATDYRVAVRFRKNFHRSWLFYEIAPEYSWPVTLGVERAMIEIDRRSKWLLFFRLEIHFGNASKRRYQDYNKIR